MVKGQLRGAPKRKPADSGGIVACLRCDRGKVYLRKVNNTDCVSAQVPVRVAKCMELLQFAGSNTRFFDKLPPRGNFQGLIHVNESARQSPASDEWSVLASDQQYLRLLFPRHHYNVYSDSRPWIVVREFFSAHAYLSLKYLVVVCTIGQRKLPLNRRRPNAHNPQRSSEATMAIFAEAYVLRLEVPYSEYWLPLAIGIGVGLCALTVSKFAFGRRELTPNVKTPQAQNHDPFTQGSSTEQRKSFRRQGNPIQIFIALPDDKDRPERGWVLDRSMGGMCIQVNEEVAVGTLLAVLAVNAPSMTPWVDIEVRTCRAVQDGFELGCQFLKTPAWSILLMFG